MQRRSGATERLSNRRGFGRRACINNPENRLKTCLTSTALLLEAVAATQAVGEEGWPLVERGLSVKGSEV